MSTTSVEVATVPRCSAPSCSAALVLRGGWKPGATGNGWTQEQRACGVWYDYPLVFGSSLTGHTSSALLPVAAEPAVTEKTR